MDAPEIKKIKPISEYPSFDDFITARCDELAKAIEKERAEIMPKKYLIDIMESTLALNQRIAKL